MVWLMIQLLDTDMTPTLSILQYLADLIGCKMKFVGLVAYEDVVAEETPSMV